MSHTPGPWNFRKDGNTRLLDSEAKDRDGHSLVSFGDTTYYPWADASDADWQLISAAPDLLEVLRGIIDIDKRDLTNPKYDGYFNSARAAIAKAEGKP